MYQPKTTAIAVLRLILSVVANPTAVITRVQIMKIFRNPILLSTTDTNRSETTVITTNGPHQAALRRKSAAR